MVSTLLLKQTSRELERFSNAFVLMIKFICLIEFFFFDLKMYL